MGGLVAIWIIFPYIGLRLSSQMTFIFFRGVETTNQEIHMEIPMWSGSSKMRGISTAGHWNLQWNSRKFHPLNLSMQRRAATKIQRVSQNRSSLLPYNWLVESWSLFPNQDILKWPFRCTIVGQTRRHVKEWTESSQSQTPTLMHSGEVGLWTCIYDILWHSMTFYDILWHSMTFYDILWL